MGLSTAKLGVDALGIELEKINALSPDERFKQIADGIAALSTQQEKNVVATQLFGKAGAKMIQVFEMGSTKLTEMQEAAEALGISLGAFASAQIEKFNDRHSASSSAQITRDSIDKSMRRHAQTSLEMYNGVTLTPIMQELLRESGVNLNADMSLAE